MRSTHTRVVVFIAACLSVLAFHWHFHRSDILLDGDAVAHINIARRVFDSKTPGPLQLGTVWLPLPHILIMPFVISDWMWRTGFGGSIPSMVAYVFAVLGIFRLIRRALRDRKPDRGATAAAYFGALMFALNSNLLYLQATAMTELLYLAFFIWAVVYFTEFADEAAGREERDRGLRNCGLCLAAGMLTRYDAWFAAGAIGCAVVVVAWRRAGAEAVASRDLAPVVRPVRQVAKFVVIVAAVPVFWLAYNGVVFGSPLAFITGPYSARAIEQRGYQTFSTHPPGFHSLHTAVFYFLKTVQLDMGRDWWGKVWLVIAAAGVFLVPGKARRLWPWLMLWIPLVFYPLSIAYAGASIHVPMWWPFSYYNLRYGVQLVPAVAVFSAAAVYGAAGVVKERWQWIPAVVVGAAVLVSYNSIWSVPICLQEARANSRTRVELESKLADVLKTLPSGSTILMYTGGHGGALQAADIPFHRVIWEGNHGDWKHALARRGLWEEAIENPAQYVDYAVGFDEDEVSVSAQKNGLRRMAEIDVPGQARAVVYATGR